MMCRSSEAVSLGCLERSEFQRSEALWVKNELAIRLQILEMTMLIEQFAKLESNWRYINEATGYFKKKIRGQSVPFTLL